MAEKLIAHHDSIGTAPPKNLESYWELFMGLDLMYLGPLGTAVKPGAWSVEAKRIFSYACYLSFCSNSMDWEEGMRPILGQLEDLLEQLEGEHLSQRFNAFLAEARLPTADRLKERHRKALNRARVRRHRQP